MLARLKPLSALFVCLYLSTHLSGCTSAHVAAVSKQSLQDLRVKSAYSVSRSADWRLSADTTMGLVLPRDHYDQPRKRSIFILNEELSEALRQAFPATDNFGVLSHLDTALQMAQERGKQLLLWPVLGDVDDRLSSRAEIGEGRSLHPDRKRGPDRVAFHVLIYDAYSGRLIDNARVSARGRIFSTVNEGPLDLYAQAAKTYVQSLVGNGPATN